MDRKKLVYFALLGIVFTAVTAASTYYVAPRLRSKPHLVIIVPGTYSNDHFWPSVVPGQVTFGSELQQALGEQGRVEPFLWASSINHQNREEAAEMLVKEIDAKASKYSRISLVGHSHGGNVALLASGMCKTRIDTIVCLATPHVYLRTVGPQGNRYAVPIYCSQRTRQNTRAIISVVAASDAVPDVWSTEVFLGLRENKAIDLTRDWREKLQDPRLADDSLLSRLFERSNVVTARELSVADHNLQLASQADDMLGTKAHSQIHSRRLGKLIGDVIQQGERGLEALAGTVIPAEADIGEPISPAEHAAWLEQNKQQIVDAGWVLQRATLRLMESANTHSDIDGSLPDPVLRICCGAAKKPCLETNATSDCLTLEHKHPTFLPGGLDWFLEVCDSDPPGAEFLGDRQSKLGRLNFADSAIPPAKVTANEGQGIQWSGEFTWLKAHF